MVLDPNQRHIMQAVAWGLIEPSHDDQVKLAEGWSIWVYRWGLYVNIHTYNTYFLSNAGASGTRTYTNYGLLPVQNFYQRKLPYRTYERLVQHARDLGIHFPDTRHLRHVAGQILWLHYGDPTQESNDD